MSIIDDIVNLISEKYDSVKLLWIMTKLEMRLAKLSIYPLIVNVCMIFAVLLTVWGAVMTLIGYGALLIYNHILAAVGAVLVLNVLLLFILKRYLLYNIRNISFERTRRYFSGMSTTVSEYESHEQSKGSDSSAPDSGTAVTESTTQN